MTTRSDGSPFKDEARLKGGLKNLVTNIQNEIFYARKDGFSGRVHTNLTTLPKIIRKYITVEEEPLVQVDMVSAQPMLFHSLAKDIVHDKKELERYKDLVESGGFYDHFADCFSPDYDVKKKKLATLIQVFFDKPKLYEYKAQTKFKKDFPAMFDFIGIIKAPNYKNMALLLQTEEVDFMLGKVIPEFRRRFPETFFSTIHDSIVVKKSDGNKALEVMAWAYEQEGYSVKLGIEEF